MLAPDQTAPVPASGRGQRLLLPALIALFTLAATINAARFAQTFPDEIDYWQMATHLAHSGLLSLDGLHPTAYRPPLLAWLLAPLVAAGCSMAQARIAMMIFYVLTGLGLWAIVRRITSSTLAAVAAITLGLGNPAYFFSAGNLYPQGLHCPLLLFIVWCLLGERETPRQIYTNSVLIGLAGGIALLGAANLAFPLLAIFFFLARRDLGALRARDFPRAGSALIAGLSILLVLAPYLYRNHTRVHPGIYLSLNTGVNLLLGNAPGTGPDTGILVDLSTFKPANFDELSEFDRNQSLLAAAKANLHSDPGHYARLYLAKFLNGFQNSASTATHGDSPEKSLLMWGFILVPWSAALTGLGFVLAAPPWLRARLEPAAFARARLLTLATFAIYLLNNAGYAIFFTRLRFRIPMDVLLAAVAGLGVWWIYARVGERWPRRRPA